MQHSSRAYLQTQANGYVCAHVSFNISYLKDKSIPVVCYFYTFLLQEIVWNHRGEMKNHTRHRVYPSGTDRWFPVTDPNFLVLLLNYTLSMIGNLTIIALTLLDSHLKTPICFCLRNFPFLEISFTSACVPRSLITTVNRENTVSYTGCMAQLFFTYSWKLQNFAFWRLCPMTAMLPCANFCIVHPSWAAQFVISWNSVLGQLASRSFSLHWFWVFTWIFVIQMLLIISFVIFLLSYKCLAQTHIY